jgi:hypothetical protein
MNIFVNIIRLMQRVQDARRERENYILSTMKTYIFIWVMPLYIYIYISRGSGKLFW